jgi:hypothetical protein
MALTCDEDAERLKARSQCELQCSGAWEPDHYALPYRGAFKVLFEVRSKSYAEVSPYLRWIGDTIWIAAGTASTIGGCNERLTELSRWCTTS